ncbi:DNA polymerase III subunit gamma/tau [Thalassomonas sp. M1454]|uniref:DNA polymerase III subunit gamma/tau n=1 Tax=Thalassomonas sp. M1454 TaxID=2594477 RepID=UPI00117F38CE|nr:DNA polymerase III subunit gamma/tau [Thalassomonas sp. M1454]TRX57151.1 DNA polymerase III subunit gamma/tau [Thalassomonas sp. M1454]
MSYQVLARKWRPKDFSELMGQEHVVTVLVNALMQERLHHAYLFTGTRGVGKTTIARIFAKSLNCEQGISSNPCGKCDVCEDVDAGRFVDLLEIDAASRTKVDDTREILDNVQYAPSRGRYKVYLIDEVHMLSKSSFNALLKTLEEPPPHVKFILATTDPQKLPVTVLSRCLQFHLKALTPSQIEQKLTEILAAEDVTYEDGALPLLAKAARGSMRDSLSLTDQAIAQGQGHIEVANLQQMLGGVDQNWVFKILIALIKQDAQGLLELSKNIASYAPSYHRLLAELLQLLHQVALWQLVPNSVDVDQQRATLLTKFASAMSPEDVQLYYQIVLNGRKDLAYSFDEQAGFDMVILRMLAFKPAQLANTVATNTEQSGVQFNNQFDDVELEQTTAKVATPAVEVAPQETNVEAPQHDVQELKQEIAQAPEQLLEQEAEQKPEPVLADQTPDVLTIDRNKDVSKQSLDAEQQQLEAIAQQQRNVETHVAPEPDLFAQQEPVQTPEPQQVFEKPSEISAEQAAQQEQAPQQIPQEAASNIPEHAVEAAPEVNTEALPTPLDSQSATDAVTQPVTEVEKMLAIRNQLRSRKKLSEGSSKKPVAKAALKPAQAESKLVAKTQLQEQKQASHLPIEQQAAVPTEQIKQAEQIEQTSSAGNGDTLDVAQALSNVAVTPEIEADLPAKQLADKADNLQQNMDAAEADNSLPENELLPDVSHLQVNSFNPDGIDPAVIKNANQIDVWANMIDAMGLGGRVRQLTLNATIDAATTDNHLVINLDQNFNHINSQAAADQISQCYSLLKNSNADVLINLVSDAGTTPFYIQSVINDKRLAYATDVIANDKFIKHLQNEFDAFIEENTIEAL